MTKLQRERAALAAKIIEDNPKLDAGDVAADVKRLGGWASNLHRLYVCRCNRPLADHESERIVWLEGAAVRLVIGFGVGFGLENSDDPRGAPLKVLLPSKRSNSFGGTGWIVPFTTYMGE